MVKLAEPPGIRSTHEGGAWEMAARDEAGRCWVHIDFQNLLDRMNQFQAEEFRQFVYAKLKRAEAGDLRFVDDQRHGDVDQMRSAPTVLEIRFERKLDIDEDLGLLDVRFYFSEPDHVPRMLLGLSLRTKTPDAMGLADQTAHAQEAAVIADGHFREIA